MFASSWTIFTYLDIVFVGVLAFQVLRSLIRPRIPKGLRLPPGPPRKPIVGNILQMPKDQEWLTLAKWAKEYGDLVCLSGLGKNILVINSVALADEFFERRSSIYSDRGEFTLVNDLMGWDWATTFMHYGEQWRQHRRVMNHKFQPRAIIDYQPIQLKHTRELARRIYETPDGLVKHLRHHAGAIIVEVVYGIKVLPSGDPYVATAEEAMRSLGVAGNPGAFLVDTLPILKHVPEWVPGAGFQKKARNWRKSAVRMNTAAFEFVKKSVIAGTAEPSFTSSLLEDLSAKDKAPLGLEEAIRGAGSSLYAGGADTSVLTLHIFFLAMLLFPEVQRKAQEELDKVVGPHRLPDFGDRESLPYINALCKEVVRWHPIVPLGVAHRVTQDDVFGDYFIPAGTIVVGNSWTLLHDEATYGPDTHSFRPERFLTPGVRAPTASFGYGRRVCPGRHFADATLYISIASTLSLFNISPLKDSTGKDIPVKAAFRSGFLSHPEPFQCAVTPRSDAAKDLILQET